MADTQTLLDVVTLNNTLIERSDTEKLGQQTYFQDLFAAGTRQEQFGEKAQWDYVSFSAATAPLAGPNDRFAEVPFDEFGNESVRFVDIKVATTIPGNKLFSQRALGSDNPDAAKTIALTVKSLRGRVRRGREYLASQVLQDSLTINSTNLPGTKIVDAVSFGSNTYNRSADWSTVSTLIASSELPLASDDFVETSFTPAGLMIVSSQLERQLRANTELQVFSSSVESISREWLASANAGMTSQHLTAMGLGSLEWNSVKSGYELGGTFTDYLADDRFIMLPPRSMLTDVLMVIEGFGEIPKDAYSEVSGMPISRAPQAGEYSYAVSESDPAGVRVFVGWRGMYVITNPEAVMIGTTA